MNKRKMCVLLVLIATITLLLCFCGKDNTLYDDPEDMAHGALSCIHGWKDVNMMMSLTPYAEGTKIYNIASNYFQKMMQDNGWVDSYYAISNVDLKEEDRDYYDEMRDVLEAYNVTGIKSIRQFTYYYNNSEEITIYVAKIGSKWYTVTAE